jgi:hypothetical protein
MRTTRIVAAAVVVIALGVAALAVAAASDPPLLVATGNELVAPGHHDAGEVKCVGGEPTGNPIVPCSPGTRKTMIRGSVSASQAINIVGPAAPFLEGPNTVTRNCNLDANVRGQCWGTFEWLIPGKAGKWEGTWMGQFDILSATTIYTAFGVGRGGQLDGLHLHYQAVMPGLSSPGVPRMIVFVAQVRER